MHKRLFYLNHCILRNSKTWIRFKASDKPSIRCLIFKRKSVQVIQFYNLFFTIPGSDF